MSSEVPFVLRILADTSEAEAQIESLNAEVDATVSRWKIARQEVINGLSALNQSINYTFTAIRMAARATGQTITPIQTALMGVISGTVSLMLSTATLMASTGILAGVGVALAAFTLGWQIGQTTDILAKMAAARDRLADAEANIARLMQSRVPIAGLGGF